MMRRWVVAGWIVLVVLGLWSSNRKSASVLADFASMGGNTIRISLAPDGSETNEFAQYPSITADGRYILYLSAATNIVPNDTNNQRDLFLYDRITEQTTLVTRRADGTQIHGQITGWDLSATGRYIAFDSDDDHIVAGDTNDDFDIFLLDRDTNTIELISVATNGEQGNSYSRGMSVSNDGRYVTFGSKASNFVPDDTNGVGDVFVRDRQLGTTTLISEAMDGGVGNEESWAAEIAANGRYVTFISYADNLVPGDTAGYRDSFWRDLVTGETRRVSVSSTGEEGNAWAAGGPTISADGRWVVFGSFADNLVPGDTNNVCGALNTNCEDWFFHDTLTHTTTRISVGSGGEQANKDVIEGQISNNGEWVMFVTDASTIVPGDTNNRYDVFRHHPGTGVTERVSLAYDGVQANNLSRGSVISDDGAIIPFSSYATNLVLGDNNNESDIFLRLMDAPPTTPTATSTFTPTPTVTPSVTPVYPGHTTLVSVNASGTQGGNWNSAGGIVSSDGRFVVFSSDASDLVSDDTVRCQGKPSSVSCEDAFVRDLQTGETYMISRASDGTQGNSHSYGLDVSADGRYALVASDADNLVPGDTNESRDIFRVDRQTGAIYRVSVSGTGGQSNEFSNGSSISGDGRYVAFDSYATNLVPNDNNGDNDIFLHDCVTGETRRISINPISGAEAWEPSYFPVISEDGRWIAFHSVASNIAQQGTDGWGQIFVYDRIENTLRIVSTTPDGTVGNGNAGTGPYSEPSVPSLSADGRYIGFTSRATNFVSNDTNGVADIFVKDRITNEITRVSIATDGTEANSAVSGPGVSGNGRFVTFGSAATTLYAYDENGMFDVFLHDRDTGLTVIASRAEDGAQGNGGSTTSFINGNGDVVSFHSVASNLTPDDTNVTRDVFVRVFSLPPMTVTPTLPPTMTPTVTPTGSATATASNTPVPTASSTATSAPTGSATVTASVTSIATGSATATVSGTPLPTGTASATSAPTTTSTPTVVTDSTPTQTALPSVTATVTVSATRTLIPPMPTSTSVATGTPGTSDSRLYLPLIP